MSWRVYRATMSGLTELSVIGWRHDYRDGIPEQLWIYDPRGREARPVGTRASLEFERIIPPTYKDSNTALARELYEQFVEQVRERKQYAEKIVKHSAKCKVSGSRCGDRYCHGDDISEEVNDIKRIKRFLAARIPVKTWAEVLMNEVNDKPARKKRS